MKKIRIYKDGSVLRVFVWNWHRNICKHLRIWKEADYYTEYGGKACKKCIESKLVK